MRNILKIRGKKAVMNQIISVFILMLIISILAGMTFLFVGTLKTQVKDTAPERENSTAYLAVNKTEAAGYQTVSYLGILFLALIFGAILTVILRVILPYINLGQQMSGGF